MAPRFSLTIGGRFRPIEAKLCPCRAKPVSERSPRFRTKGAPLALKGRGLYGGKSDEDQGWQTSTGKGRVGRRTCPSETRSGQRSEDGKDARLRKAAALDRLGRATHATKLYREYISHSIARFVMNFKQFRNPRQRARILNLYGQ